jgi:hypothetical protein
MVVQVNSPSEDNNTRFNTFSSALWIFSPNTWFFACEYKRAYIRYAKNQVFGEKTLLWGRINSKPCHPALSFFFLTWQGTYFPQRMLGTRVSRMLGTRVSNLYKNVIEPSKWWHNRHFLTSTVRFQKLTAPLTLLIQAISASVHEPASKVGLVSACAFLARQLRGSASFIHNSGVRPLSKIWQNERHFALCANVTFVCLLL